MIRAVLFDLDGVLVDTERINSESAVLSMKEQGIVLSFSDKKLITGRNPVDFSVDFAKKYEFNRALMIRRHKFFYDRLYFKARPFAFARSVVRRVSACGFLCGLVTSSRLSTIGRALRILKLSKSSFDVFVSFENCKKRKPSPEPYLFAAKLLKVIPKECLVIEDSVVGVLSAKRAGMKCIAITSTFPASKLKRADFVVKNLGMVKSLLC